MGAPQSGRAVLAGLAAFALLAIGVAAFAATGRIELPTPADAVVPSTPLIVPRAGEVDISTLPGSVADTETTRVALAPDGSVVGVAVDQTLVMRGVGDFNVVLPGPALHVVGPADQATQPGLRRGTILYQGFVPGTKTLRATATLDPAFERFRVPLLVTVRFVQDGRVVEPPVTGPVEIRVTIANNTGRIVPFHVGPANTSELADLLDALRRELRAGRAPIAGVRGVPRSLASTSAVHTNRLSVAVPFDVAGTIRFPSGTIAGLRVAGPATLAPGAPGVDLRASLPSAAIPGGTAVIRLQGTASALGAPQLAIDAEGTLPDEAGLEPNAAPDWHGAFAGAGETRRAAALQLAESTMWQVLRIHEFDAYLGNPGTGRSKTTYVYTTAPVAAPRAHAPPERLRTGALALTLLAAALAIGNAAMLWTRS